MAPLSPRFQGLYFVWLFLIAIACASAAVYWMLTSPRVVLLLPARGAQWIRRDEPFELNGRPDGFTYSEFLTDFVARTNVPTAVLRVSALRRVVVVVDGKTLFDTGSRVVNWRTEYLVPLSKLASGRHELKLRVANRAGPSLVRADCSELAIQTGSNWRASKDRHQWSPAVLADSPWEPALTAQFATTQSDLLRLWPLLVLLFAGGCLLSLLVFDARPDHPAPDGTIARWGVVASRLRWIVLAGWAVLAMNNLAKLPLVGYDAPSHFEYIRYVAEHAWLPLPNEGSEFFQTPVYYIVSAVFYKVFSVMGATPATLAGILRIIPFMCGAAMVQICYLAAGYFFARRNDLRAVATVVGGLIPVNLYMGQSLSNEPMAACASGILILLVLRFLLAPVSRQGLWLLAIGAVYSLAILTKLSAAVWGFPLLTVLLLRLNSKPIPWQKKIGLLALVPASVLGIAGPYFLRNRVRTSQWIFPNSQVFDARWWQDPGFRTLPNLLHFGQVFSHPVYSGVGSIWDSLYSTIWASGMLNGMLDYQHRPPWNYGLMSCGLWLAIFPMILLAVGCIRSVFSPAAPGIASRSGLRFLLLGLLSFIPAILYVFLTLPIYACAKGSYLLGTVPCLAVLAATGFELLTRQRLIRAAAFGLLFTWAVTAYFTFFLF